MFRRRQMVRYLIRAPICITLLVIGVLAYLGKFNSSKIFDVARKAISDIQNIKSFTLDINKVYGNIDNSTKLEYYGGEKLEKYILSRNGQTLTEIIYDYDKGKMYVRVDTLTNEGLNFENIENIGRKWNGEQWIKSKNYMVLNTRVIASEAQKNGELYTLTDWIEGTPKIKGLVYGIDKPAYGVKVSKGDDLAYLYSDFIIYLLESAIQNKYITRSGITESKWSIETKDKEETKEFIDSTINNINRADSYKINTLITLISAAKGKETSKDTLINEIQDIAKIDLDGLSKSITETNEDVTMKFEISFEDKIGKANLLVKEKCRNEEGRSKTDIFRVNYLSRGDTSVELRVPNREDCVECNSIEEFGQLNEYLKIENIIDILLMNNESEGLIK